MRTFYSKARKLLIIILFGLVSLTFLTCDQKARHPFSKRTKEVLNKLDSILSSRDYYEQQWINRIDALKLSLAGAAGDDLLTLEILDRISDQYSTYNADSSKRYLDLHLNLATKLGNPDHLSLARMNLVNWYRKTGLFFHAYSLLTESRAYVDSSELYSYYSACASLFTALETYSSSKEFHSVFSSQNQLYRDSLVNVSAENESLRILIDKADRYRYSGHPQDALDILIPEAEKLDFESNLMRVLGGCLGACSHQVGNLDDAMYYYALAAISDIRLCAKENTSLRNLAVLLYDEGDVVRANFYLQACLQDAVSCSATLREIEVARQLPSIVGSYKKAINDRNKSLQESVIAMAIFLLVLIGLLYLLFVQNKRLNQARQMVKSSNDLLLEANSRLEQTVTSLQAVNRKLVESNRIKDEYIVQYVNLTSDCIDRINTYRFSLIKLSQKKDTNDLIRELRSTDFVEDQLRDFYASFDRTFLKIFPSFIDRFNLLLVSDKRIALKKAGLMPTEMRVFALIRLGISSSKTIADILRCSVQTVYNYRSGIHAKQIDPDIDFEKSLMDIGYSSE